MPDRKRVQAFIDTVAAGDHVRAIAEFYHADATMQEPGRPPRSGRDELIAHEAAALERMTMVTHPPEDWLVDGDRVAIRWVFDMTGADGVTRRLEEIALQTWRGDRIETERFFYDRALAAEPIKSGRSRPD